MKLNAPIAFKEITGYEKNGLLKLHRSIVRQPLYQINLQNNNVNPIDLKRQVGHSGSTPGNVQSPELNLKNQSRAEGFRQSHFDNKVSTRILNYASQENEEPPDVVSTRR